MFKSLTMLVGGAAGLYMAVATGAPNPSTLLPQLGSLAHASSFMSDGTGKSASCKPRWNTEPAVSSRTEGPSTARVTEVRAGRHRCYDRLVIDLGPGARPGYRVRYVRAVHAQGSGRAIPLAGRAQLDITLTDHASSRFDASGSSIASVSGFTTFRQVAGAGSFEGYTEIGLGVKARHPFRVRVLDGPGRDSRIVIDVSHRR
jgi:hypothetical protein